MCESISVPLLSSPAPVGNYNLIPLDYFIRPDILSLALIYSDPNVVVPLVLLTYHGQCTRTLCSCISGRAKESPQCCWRSLRGAVVAHI